MSENELTKESQEFINEVVENVIKDVEDFKNQDKVIDITAILKEKAIKDEK